MRAKCPGIWLGGGVHQASLFDQCFTPIPFYLTFFGVTPRPFKLCLLNGAFGHCIPGPPNTSTDSEYPDPIVPCERAVLVLVRVPGASCPTYVKDRWHTMGDHGWMLGRLFWGSLMSPLPWGLMRPLEGPPREASYPHPRSRQS